MFLKNFVGAVKYWWLILILGILCILCAIGVFCTPASGTATLAMILMINLILVGIIGIIFVIANRESIPAWGWNLILPILTVIAGIVLACNPTASLVFVVCIFSAGVIFKGIETIIYAISLSKIEGSGWGWTLVAGIIGLLLGIFLCCNPLFAGLTLGIFVGFALLFMGIEAIALSIQLSKIKGEAKKVEKAVDEAIEEAQNRYADKK